MITIDCFEGFPIEYDSFLIDRYGSFATTCGYIEIYRPDYSIHYMLVHEDSDLIDLLIFGFEKKSAICLNVLADIEQKILSECINLLFKEFPAIDNVLIDASLIPYKIKKSFLVKTSEDYVLNLPENIDDYLNLLGSSTRKNIKSRKNKLLRNFSSVNFVTKYGADIEDGIVDKIVQLNFDRMICKGTIPAIDLLQKSNIYKYSQHYGCVSYLELDGKIVAGCIASIINRDIFLHVYAHDNNFSKYNIGESCVFYLIETSIQNQLSTLHFLWGQNELKTRLQAKPHVLFSSLVYRAYSFPYYANRIAVFLKSNLNKIKQLPMLKPLKDAVKSYRKSRSKKCR